MKFRSMLPMVGLLFASAAAAGNGVQLQWFGHSAFQLKSPGGKVIVIDPFLSTTRCYQNGCAILSSAAPST